MAKRITPICDRVWFDNIILLSTVAPNILNEHRNNLSSKNSQDINTLAYQLATIYKILRDKNTAESIEPVVIKTLGYTDNMYDITMSEYCLDLIRSIRTLVAKIKSQKDMV